MNVVRVLMTAGLALSALMGGVAGVSAMKEKPGPKRQRLFVLCVSALYASIVLGLLVVETVRAVIAAYRSCIHLDHQEELEDVSS